MYFCPNCGKTSEEQVAFCSQCGTAMKQQGVVQAEESAPVYTPPAYTPVHEAEPVSSSASKVKGIVGMILGISGLVFAGLGLLYVLIGLAADPAVAFGMSVGFGIFSMPLSIVGKVLCGGAIEAGNTSGMARAGRTLGHVGMILSIVMFGLGFFALILGAADL